MKACEVNQFHESKLNVTLDLNMTSSRNYEELMQNNYLYLFFLLRGVDITRFMSLYHDPANHWDAHQFPTVHLINKIAGYVRAIVSILLFPSVFYSGFWFFGDYREANIIWYELGVIISIILSITESVVRLNKIRDQRISWARRRQRR